MEKVNVWVRSRTYTVLSGLQASEETWLLLGGSRQGKGRYVCQSFLWSVVMWENLSSLRHGCIACGLTCHWARMLQLLSIFFSDSLDSSIQRRYWEGTVRHRVIDQLDLVQSLLVLFLCFVCPLWRHCLLLDGLLPALLTSLPVLESHRILQFFAVCIFAGDVGGIDEVCRPLHGTMSIGSWFWLLRCRFLWSSPCCCLLGWPWRLHSPRRPRLCLQKLELSLLLDGTLAGLCLLGPHLQLWRAVHGGSLIITLVCLHRLAVLGRVQVRDFHPNIGSEDLPVNEDEFLQVPPRQVDPLLRWKAPLLRARQILPRACCSWMLRVIS